jgi:hypothetical protein
MPSCRAAKPLLVDPRNGLTRSRAGLSVDCQRAATQSTATYGFTIRKLVGYLPSSSVLGATAEVAGMRLECFLTTASTVHVCKACTEYGATRVITATIIHSDSIWYGECSSTSVAASNCRQFSGVTNMRLRTDTHEPGNQRNAREEIRKSLEKEQGTARRQELLKALWRLSQPGEQVDSTLQTNKVSASPDTQRQPTVTASREIERLSVSC